MSARPLALLLSAFALVACTGQEQALGGGSAPASNDPPPVPTTWVTAPHAFECPRNKPTEGSACEAFDENDAAIAAQCDYDLRTSCPSVCVCGFGGRWSCFHTACGILTVDGCHEGAECADGAGCSTDTLICSCSSTGSDGKLHCVPRSNP